MKHRRTAAVAVVGVLALTACQEDRDTKGEARSDPTAAPLRASPCDLLTAKQRRELIGEATPEAHELGAGCLWHGPEGPNSFHVSAATMPASEWAAETAGTYRGLFEADLVPPASRGKFTRFRRLLASVGDDDSRACEVFVTWGEMNGAAAGSRTLTKVIPPSPRYYDSVPEARAERCIDGTYTEVSFSGPGVREAEAPRLGVAALDEISPIASTG